MLRPPALLALALSLATLSRASLSLAPPASGWHQGCSPPQAEATAVGSFYVVGSARFVFEETNGVPGLQDTIYGCPGHPHDVFPSDTCYFDREQPTSTRCPSMVLQRWLP